MKLCIIFFLIKLFISSDRILECFYNSVWSEIELYEMTDCQGHLNKWGIHFIQNPLKDFSMFLFNLLHIKELSSPFETHQKRNKRLIKGQEVPTFLQSLTESLNIIPFLPHRQIETNVVIGVSIFCHELSSSLGTSIVYVSKSKNDDKYIK